MKRAPEDVVDVRDLVIRSDRRADALVLELYGELDLASAGRFDRELRDAETTSSQVVVDLSGLEFMDSTGLHTLLDANQRCLRTGCRLFLIRGPRQVQRVFEITQTVQAFSFDD